LQLGDPTEAPPEKDQSYKLDDYVVMRTLGSGAYATVKFATQKSTKKKVAFKIYPKYKLNDTTKRKSVMREIQVMKKFEHPNIIRLYDSFETPKEIYLV
jgi:serine/threonine protein kinase